MKNFFKRYQSTALFGMLFGMILYSFMMFQQLTNTFDGLWHQNYHHAAIAELELGRWMLYFIDKFNMGLHAEPLTSFITLGLFILGFLLVLELMGVENKTAAFLSLALWVSSTVISITLSYRMTAMGYGFAYCFSVLAVYSSVKIDKKVIAAILSGVFLGLSMACYQACFGVFCVVAVFYFMMQCSAQSAYKETNYKMLLGIIQRIICSIAIGAGFYMVSLSFFLKINNVSLSGYNGGNSITLSELIGNLPQKICKTYHYFKIYYLTDILKINRLQYLGGLDLFLILLVVLGILTGVRLWKKDKICFIFFGLAFLALPIACNAYMLLAGNKLELQMTAGLAMLIPLTILLAFSYIPKRNLSYFVCTVFCMALIYGNSMQVWFDQEAMYEGTNSCETMMNQVIADLQSNGLLEKDYNYFFVGAPSKNQYFSVSEIYSCANAYAQAGNFWLDGYCGSMSYQGLINKRMGFSLPILYAQDAQNILGNDDTNKIPSFPENGYFFVWNDKTVIIKIS